MKWPVTAFDEIDSTNQEAQRRLAAGARAATWITAEQQTAGRGRSGRSWQSLEGNLFASLLLPLECPPHVLHQLSLVSGLALHNAVSACDLPEDRSSAVRLKWPNDVLIDDAKVAGILVESSVVGSLAVAVLGFGVNLKSAPDLPNRKTVSLAALDIAISPAEFLETLDHSLATAIRLWDLGAGFDRIREAWLEHAFAIGHPMSVNANAGNVTGTFAGLDKDGALLISTSGGKIETFHFGDVALA